MRRLLVCYTLRVNRTIGYILALAILLGLAYAIYTYVPKAPPLQAVNTGEQKQDGTEIKVETVSEDTSTYLIDIRYPQFGIPLADVKIKAIVDNAMAAFKSYPANPPDSAAPKNEFTSSFSSTYVGADIVSVALTISEYTGGAHPNTVIIGVNVDPKTGEEVTLDDALGMIGKNLQQVSEESLVQLRAELGADIIAPEGASPVPDNYSTFLVSKDKVTFIFNNYQVAPYSAGPQSVEFARK